jgi:hypothetical protein
MVYIYIYYKLYLQYPYLDKHRATELSTAPGIEALAARPGDWHGAWLFLAPWQPLLWRKRMGNYRWMGQRNPG